MTAKKLPQTIEDLADEDLEGFDRLLGPQTYRMIHDLLCDLYAGHPVMSRLAEEALSDAHAARRRREQSN